MKLVPNIYRRKNSKFYKTSQQSILQNRLVIARIGGMTQLWDRLETLCEAQGTSPYGVALSVGVDGSLPQKVFNNKIKATFDRKLNLLQKMQQSSLWNIDMALLEAWLVEEYISEKAKKLLGKDKPL